MSPLVGYPVDTEQSTGACSTREHFENVGSVAETRKKWSVGPEEMAPRDVSRYPSHLIFSTSKTISVMAQQSPWFPTVKILKSWHPYGEEDDHISL